MTDVPDRVVLKRDRDLEGRRNEIWLRRLFAIMCVVPVSAVTDA